MSYRCQLCNDPVPPGTPLRRHVVYRQDRSIEQEIPVCRSCGDDLAAGLGIIDVLRKRAVPPPLTVEEVLARPEPELVPEVPASPTFVAATPIELKLPALNAKKPSPVVLGQRKLRSVKDRKAVSAIIDKAVKPKTPKKTGA